MAKRSTDIDYLKMATPRRLEERPPPEVIGAQIKEAREAKGWSQAKLGKAVGTTQQTIEKIESGRIKRTGYLTEILIELGLPHYESTARPERSPVFTSIGRLPVGKFLTARREAIGMEIAELAALAKMNSRILQHLEELTEEPSPLSANAVLAKQVLEALATLERAAPQSEPYGYPGYHVAALPSGEVDFPYFKMGEQRGIQFEYFGPSPWDLPRLRGFFCITLAYWVRGAYHGQPLRAGTKLYGRPFRQFDPKDPISVIAHKAGAKPEDVDEIIVATLVDDSNNQFTLNLSDDATNLVLPRKEWNLAQIHLAVLSDLSKV